MKKVDLERCYSAMGSEDGPASLFQVRRIVDFYVREYDRQLREILAEELGEMEERLKGWATENFVSKAEYESTLYNFGKHVVREFAPSPETCDSTSKENDLPKSGMSGRALKALNKSIEIWRDRLRGKNISMGPSNCPLCVQFHDFVNGDANCSEECPIRKHTGRSGCLGTPHTECASHYQRCSVRDTRECQECNRLIYAELDFLKSLLPNATCDCDELKVLERAGYLWKRMDRDEWYKVCGLGPKGYEHAERFSCTVTHCEFCKLPLP